MLSPHTSQPPLPPKGLGYEYETALAVSPLQKLLTYARGEAVLTAAPAWAWRAVEDWLVPLAEGLGYKVGPKTLGLIRSGFGATGCALFAGRGTCLLAGSCLAPRASARSAPVPRSPLPQAFYPQYSTRAAAPKAGDLLEEPPES